MELNAYTSSSKETKMMEFFIWHQFLEPGQNPPIPLQPQWSSETQYVATQRGSIGEWSAIRQDTLLSRPSIWEQNPRHFPHLPHLLQPVNRGVSYRLAAPIPPSHLLDTVRYKSHPASNLSYPPATTVKLWKTSCYFTERKKRWVASHLAGYPTL